MDVLTTAPSDGTAVGEIMVPEWANMSYDAQYDDIFSKPLNLKKVTPKPDPKAQAKVRFAMLLFFGGFHRRLLAAAAAAGACVLDQSRSAACECTDRALWACKRVPLAAPLLPGALPPTKSCTAHTALPQCFRGFRPPAPGPSPSRMCTESRAPSCSSTASTPQRWAQLNFAAQLLCNVQLRGRSWRVPALHVRPQNAVMLATVCSPCLLTSAWLWPARSFVQDKIYLGYMAAVHLGALLAPFTFRCG